MTKRLLILCLALCMSGHLTGCSSSGAKEDSEVAESNDDTFAEESESDFAKNGDKPTAEGDTAAPAPEDGDLTMDGDAGAAPKEEQKAAKSDKPAAGGDDELSLDDPELPDDVANKPADAPPADPSAQAQAPAEGDKAPTDEPLFTDEPKQDVAKDAAPAEPAPEPAAPVEAPSKKPRVHSASSPVAYAPIQKINSAAFTKNGVTLNRVYLGRPGDTVKKVSDKIYGQNKTKDLIAWNGFLRRGVRTGDKVYYASPTNPSDNRMLTSFEEANVPPQTYVSKPGDNIRTVSKQLLGFNDAWKEVWSTNLNVESRGALPQGTELRYWPQAASAPVAPLAANNPPPAAPPSPPVAPPANPNDPFAANNTPPGPPTDPTMAANDPLAPPPDIPPPGAPTPAATAGTAGTVAKNEPPPPPPPAPPPVEQPNKQTDVKPVKKAAVAEESTSATSDPETIMTIGAVGILLIAAALLIVVIRKNRAKRMDLGQTQV